jgi:hypothetical protein
LLRTSFIGKCAKNAINIAMLGKAKRAGILRVNINVAKTTKMNNKVKAIIFF